MSAIKPPRPRCLVAALTAALALLGSGKPAMAAGGCGGGWAVIPSPNVGSTGNALNAVVSSSPETWAVGYTSNGTPYFQPLIERALNGEWSVVPSPNLGLGGFLSGVALIPQTRNVWSVGFGYLGSTRPTLIEE